MTNRKSKTGGANATPSTDSKPEAESPLSQMVAQICGTPASTPSDPPMQLPNELPDVPEVIQRELATTWFNLWQVFSGNLAANEARTNGTAQLPAEAKYALTELDQVVHKVLRDRGLESPSRLRKHPAAEDDHRRRLEAERVVRTAQRLLDLNQSAGQSYRQFLLQFYDTCEGLVELTPSFEALKSFLRGFSRAQLVALLDARRALLLLKEFQYTSGAGSLYVAKPVAKAARSQAAKSVLPTPTEPTEQVRREVERAIHAKYAPAFGDDKLVAQKQICREFNITRPQFWQIGKACGAIRGRRPRGISGRKS